MGPQEGPKKPTNNTSKTKPKKGPKIIFFRGPRMGRPKPDKNRVKRHPKRVHFRISVLDPPREPQESAREPPREAQEGAQIAPRSPREHEESSKGFPEERKRYPAEPKRTEESHREL